MNRAEPPFSSFSWSCFKSRRRPRCDGRARTGMARAPFGQAAEARKTEINAAAAALAVSSEQRIGRGGSWMIRHPGLGRGARTLSTRAGGGTGDFYAGMTTACLVVKESGLATLLRMIRWLARLNPFARHQRSRRQAPV